MRVAALACAVLLVVGPARVSGQDVSAEQREEARARVERALRLFDEERYDAALAELRAAYATAPTYRVLYNIGRVHAELGDAVRAADAYAQYLREGGHAIEEDRRAEVEERLREQEARIGRVRIVSSVDGAEVSVDGAVATGADGRPLVTPLAEPLRLTAGRHRITLRAAHHHPSEREVELAGGVDSTVTFALVEARADEATLRVTSPLAGVRIVVDGELVGETPLAQSVVVAPGEHVVEARRAGYVPARRAVAVEARAEAEVRFALEPDPDAPPEVLGRVRLRLPDASFALSVDGRPVDARTFTLPQGEHVLTLEVAEREPVRERIVIAAGETAEITPELVWTPQAREERVSEAATLRALGLIGTIAGGIALAAGGIGFVVAQGHVEEHEADIAELRRLLPLCADVDADPACRDADGDLRDFDAEAEAIEPDRDRWFTTRTVTGVAALAGAAILGTGLALLVAAPSTESIDAEARATLVIEASPSSIVATITF